MAKWPGLPSRPRRHLGLAEVRLRPWPPCRRPTGTAGRPRCAATGARPSEELKKNVELLLKNGLCRLPSGSGVCGVSSCWTCDVARILQLLQQHSSSLFRIFHSLFSFPWCVVQSCCLSPPAAHFAFAVVVGRRCHPAPAFYIFLRTDGGVVPGEHASMLSLKYKYASSCLSSLTCRTPRARSPPPRGRRRPWSRSASPASP